MSRDLRFRRLRLRNWKNFLRVDVALQDRLFLVGANASGKSNFLDAFRFLRDIALSGSGFREPFFTRVARLMADAERLAAFMGVARNKVPADPEGLEHPKQVMVNLARLSRRRDVRQDMVPREASGRTAGPAYTSRLIEYATDRWRPHVAVQRADSLRRAVECLERLTTAST